MTNFINDNNSPSLMILYEYFNKLVKRSEFKLNTPLVFCLVIS